MKGLLNPKRRFALIISPMVVGMVSLAAVAFADNVQNDVVAGGNDTITAGGSTTINYHISATGVGNDGQSGCNAGDTTPATVTINAPPGVTASPGSLTFTACGTAAKQAVVFSSNTPGDHTITVSVSDSGVGTYSTNQATFTLHVNAAPPSDTTAPVIEPTVTGTLGDNGWYTSDVKLTWSVSDPESAISSQTGCGETNITSDQQSVDYTCSATSAGGTSSETVSIKRDASAPTVSCDSPAPSFLLNQSPANVTGTAADGGSGPASQNLSKSADTSSVGGGKTVTLTASDAAGNEGSATCSYSVGYKFEGFYTPVDNGNVLNAAKAGQAIPLKWRLLDANNNPVTSLSSVKVTVTSLACALGTTQDGLEEYAAGSSGLQNLGSGYYQFNWKSPSNYASSCKTLNLDLGEGNPRTALFKFTK